MIPKLRKKIFRDLRLSHSILNQETFYLIETLLINGDANIRSVNYNLPPTEIPLVNELDGPLFLSILSGRIIGCVRTHSIEHARKVSLDKFKIPKSANPFASLSFMDKNLDQDSKGNVIVTKDLEVVQLTYDLMVQNTITIHISL